MDKKMLKKTDFFEDVEPVTDSVTVTPSVNKIVNKSVNKIDLNFEDNENTTKPMTYRLKIETIAIIKRRSMKKGVGVSEYLEKFLQTAFEIIKE
ncbi:MAG TPA: hypothetical protein VIK78_14440 [Ruminiclostridium sp.]